MPTIVDRDATVALLRGEFAAVAELGAALDASQWDRPTDLPGWTVKDNLSHLVGTESMLAGEASPSVDVTHLGHVHNAIGDANEAWVESLRALPGPQVLERFTAVAARRLAALDAKTQADFDAPTWTPAGPDETYGRFMRIRHYDCFLHEHDMRLALDLPDRAAPADVASALDEVATGLGYIVGRRAALPRGARVRIAVTGPVPRTYLVAVEDRARLVEDLGAEPTCGLVLPAMLFLRLTGGRLPARPHVGVDLTLEGDEAQAAQLADHLAFTV